MGIKKNTNIGLLVFFIKTTLETTPTTKLSSLKKLDFRIIIVPQEKIQGD